MAGLVDDGPRSESRSRRGLARTAAFLVLYALAILVGRTTRVPPSELALAWPAAGVAITWLLLARSRRESGVAAALVVITTAAMNHVSGLEATSAWMFGVVNLVHGLVGTMLLRSWPGRSPGSPRTLRDVAALGVASIGAASVSAFLGGVIAWSRLDGDLLDGVGMIGARNALSSFVVVNALLATRELRTSRRGGLVGCAAVSVGGLTLSALLLTIPWPVAFAVVPIVLGVALRCGPQLTSVFVALQGVVVVAATVKGLGPFGVIESAELRVILAQTFILVLALVGLVMAVLEQERDVALASSRRDRDKLRDHMEAALVASAHLVMRGDGTCRCDAANAALVALTGRGRHELVDSDPRRWFVPADASRLAAAVDELRARRGDGWRGQLRADDAWGGAWVDVAMAIATADATKVAGHEAFTSITLQMVDITAQKRAEQALEHAALHDDLTGLANRSLWTARLDEAVRAAVLDRNPVVVMYIDVDHFKKINDGYGHTVGDAVLRDIAARLSALVGEGGTVARIGGDEFVLVSRPGRPGHAERVAERIEDAMAAPTRLEDGRYVSFTVSIGIAETSGDVADGRLLLRQADAALYTAKERGRARFERYVPALNGGLEASARLLIELGRGHEADEFGLVYQPIIDAATGDIAAVEALLRWNHPERGRLCPAAFLDVLEVSELMHAVGDRALRAACRGGVLLAEQDVPVAVHVNVSANELARPQLVERIRSALEQSSLDPENLVLEITETRLVEVTGSLLEDIIALRALGVRIAVDDFGTGFSTLTHLVDLPIDMVKLDSSFVAGVLEPGAARSVCAGVIAMADGLGVDVVAEGVETAEQAETLRAMGYRLMQGYRWGQPGDLEHLADRWRVMRA